jgi:hypothetical protein
MGQADRRRPSQLRVKAEILNICRLHFRTPDSFIFGYSSFAIQKAISIGWNFSTRISEADQLSIIIMSSQATLQDSADTGMHEPQKDIHWANLSPAMEHLRSVVSVIPGSPSPVPSIESPAAEVAEPDNVYGVPTSVIQPIRKPATAPKQNNPEKRTDPFSFGSRFLEEGDDIFQFNAWDNVEVDEAYGKFAEEMYQKQRDNPVGETDKRMPDRFCR